MQPLTLLRALKRDAIDYVRGKYPFLSNDRPDLDEQLTQLLSESGTLFQDPVLQIGRARKKANFDLTLFGPEIRSTVETLAELKVPYAHQAVAWSQIAKGTPTVVSTGTGSGKSESFIIPVLDGLKKQDFGGSTKKIGGLFIYPMNALVQDQFLRIFKYAAGSGLRVGIYNGAFKELDERERKKICDQLNVIYKKLKEERPELEIGYDCTDPSTLVVNPKDTKTYPDILLTNYKMLEYMLLRAQDQPLIDAFDLRYLVLDEAHTYTGTLALEISCLLTRLKVHLGEERSRYLPIATSATLSAGPGSEESIEKELSKFFSKLFGKKFPETGFLIGEQYEDLPQYEKSAFEPFLKVNQADLSEALALPYPHCLFETSKILFSLSAADEQSLCNALHEQCIGLEKQLGTVLLADDAGKMDSTLSWTKAKERFQARTGGSSELLEVLLLTLSQAYKNEKFPLLGLRVHLFGRTEPKILWSLDGSRVGDERSLEGIPALSLVSCKRCDHMALAGVGENAGGDGNVSETLEIRPLGDFREEIRDQLAADNFVFHAEDAFSREELEGFGKGKGWSLYRFDLVDKGGTILAMPITHGPKPQGKAFLRVQRSAKKGNKTVDAPDMESCPKCRSTGRNDNPVMITHRGGAATDVSVYSASALTNTPDPKEQKLLIFSDNRQETSFLAGFLTDRHRKINLRRALTGYLEECAAEFGTKSLPIIQNYDRNSPSPKAFDLAIRLLASLEGRRAIPPKGPLPSSLRCQKATLQSLIPRSVLDRPHWKKPQNGRLDDEIESIKGWLLENYRIADSPNSNSTAQSEELDLLDGSKRSEWILTLITELLLLDLSSGALAEGHLATLGLGMLRADGLQEELFEDFARTNPDLGLTSKGIFLLSKWLMDELLYAGRWSDLDPTGLNRDGFLPQFVATYDPRFFHKKEEQGLLGKSINSPEGLSKIGRLAKALIDLDPENGDELRKIWAQKANWDRLIHNSPLREWVFYSSANTDAPVLKPYAPWSVTRDINHFRGSLSRSEFMAMPAEIDLSGLPTGKRSGDKWEKTRIHPNSFYLRLFKTPLSEQSKLVRAREHNGMLSAADANDALLKFEKDIINTLIATPTLEMGVDLPDLPTVIHRSVPPGAANYAQRAGRAGRGPKRALIITYCGLGSHDMTFFEEPVSMVAGEILPPGIPDRNPFIIKRHLNGLILEVLGLTDKALGQGLQIRYWHEVVDVRDLRNRLQELTRNSRNPSQFTSQQTGTDWQEILRKRTELKNRFVEQFIQQLDQNLWFDTPTDQTSRVEELKAELRRHSSEFSTHFNTQISAFRSLVTSYLDSLEQFKELPTPDDNAPFRQGKRFAELYLGANTRNSREIPRPLNDLAATGFLPNFDFPGQVIRFKGLKDDPKADQNAPGTLDRMLQYDRGGTVALREFAPDQKVYGHGFIYEVERYLENDLVENTAKGYGVCAEGCTTLTPPEVQECPECASPVVRIDRPDISSGLVPEIIQIREVHGKQVKAISDGANFRERHYFSEEARRIGAPLPDEGYHLKTESEVELQIHLTKPHYLKTVFLVLNTKRGGTSTAQKVFYRKRGKGTLHQVSLTAKEGDRDWEPFIPSIQIEGQGIIFRLPFHVAHNKGLISRTDAEDLLTYQTTLCTLIKRASQRVLRLGARGGSFDIQVERIMEQAGNTFQEKASAFILLDREPGGSGVIPLIWENWDEILIKAEETVLKDCCVTSCYRCLRSFDNQADHRLLDKRLFNVEGIVPLTRFLRREGFVRVKNDELKKVDERSPAEMALKDLLLAKFSGWSLEMQVERFKTSGGLLSIPDFELRRDTDGKRVTFFVDGWRYHQDPYYFYGDIRKRNELSYRGYRVVTLPAGLVLNPNQTKPLIEALFSDCSDILHPFPVVPDLGIAMEHVPSALDPEVKDQLLYMGVSNERVQLINFAEGQKRLDSQLSPLAKLLLEQLQQLPKELRPYGIVGEDQLIMRVYPNLILSDQEIWRRFWLVHGALSAVGYRPVLIWLGDKPRRSSQ